MMRAARAVVARERSVSSPLRSVGSGITPRSAIAAPTAAIVSGVASTFPWPIAVEPSARSSPISSAAGIVERSAPAMPGSWLKPNASAVPTSLSAPSSAPIGAKTELHEWANETRRDPPHASPLALVSSTPSSVAAVSTG